MLGESKAGPGKALGDALKCRELLLLLSLCTDHKAIHEPADCVWLGWK